LKFEDEAVFEVSKTKTEEIIIKLTRYLYLVSVCSPEYKRMIKEL
jgi:hypothetical protein